MQLLEEGKTFEEIDTELKVQSRLLYRRALRKLDQAELLKRYPRIAMNIPQTQQSAFDQELIESAKSAGLSGAILKQVHKRIAVRRGQSSTSVARPLTERETISMLQEKLHLALQFFDEYVLAGASAKDLAGTIDTLVSNIQLLQGRPTSIMSIEERRKMDELLPRVIAEARRRGVPLDLLEAKASATDAEIVK